MPWSIIFITREDASLPEPWHRQASDCGVFKKPYGKEKHCFTHPESFLLNDQLSYWPPPIIFCRSSWVMS